MATLAQTQTGIKVSTLSALRYPNFRLYFVGQLISLSGTWMQTVAQGWLVFNLTQSELWLGVVACAAGLPSLILSPFAGVLVDRFPRRDILLLSQTVQMILAFILAALTFAGVVQVWHIVTLAFLLGVTNAIDAPSRQAIIVDLVGKDDLTSGITLNSIMFNGARVFGPAAAGIALVQFGPAWCFFLNGLSFLAVLFMLWVMRVNAPARRTADFAPLERLREGVRYSRQHPTIAPLLMLAGIASMFTVNISQLLPAYADHVLRSPKVAYASMSTAVGMGAVIAGVSMAILSRRFGRGKIVQAMIVWVTTISILVTRTAVVDTAVLLMGLFGFGIILQFVTVNTLIQSEVPDEFRGRVMSLYTLTFFGVAPFGALILGFLASGIGGHSGMVLGLAHTGLLHLGHVTWEAGIRGLGTPNAMALFALMGGLLSLYVMFRSPRVRALR
jgi:MFS family permease